MVTDEASTRGRPLTADGRRKLVTARVSVAKFAAIEAARGQTSRSEWVEAAIDAYLSPPAMSAPTAHGGWPVPVYGYPADAGHGAGSAVSVYGNDEPDRPPCKHPADQVDPDAGVCRDCGEDVW